MTNRTARSGLTAEAEFSGTPSQDYAHTFDGLALGEIENLYSYNGKPAEADLFMQTDGAGGAPFTGYFGYPSEDAVVVDLLMEVEGHFNGSMVFSLGIDKPFVPEPRLLAVPVEGTTTNGEVLFRIDITDSAYRLSDTLCHGEAGVAATADTVYLLVRRDADDNEETIATVTWAAGGISATITFMDRAIAIGDHLELQAPATADTTLADLSIVFVLLFA